MPSALEVKRNLADCGKEWCKDFSNVIELANWLEAGDSFLGAAEAIDFFEKPWRWSEEYFAMRAGYPDLDSYLNEGD